MIRTTIDDARLKKLLKNAIIEVFEERGDLVRDLLKEALEDICLIRAIKEGEHTGRVSREKVFEVLEKSQ